MLLRVRVHPGARRQELRGVHGGALRIAVTAAPERGRANAAVCALLADALAVRRDAVQVVAGASGRDKTVAIEGLVASEVVGRLVGHGAG